MIGKNWYAWTAVALTVGCGGPKPPPGLSFAPAAMATDVLDQYDANRDGKLDAAALKKCPSLTVAIKAFDANKDGVIDRDELVARFESYRTRGSALRDVTPRVVRGAQPAAGIAVTLEPEPFMLGSIKPATGVSDAKGLVQLKTRDVELPGVQIGCFRIVIADPQSQKTKTRDSFVPGVEVAADAQIDIVIPLDR